ncbi:hypothetical protein SO802_002473 [Lithocarpus litseifolius]|uniref:Uncharacterized protein n=1 Tax=Lithocarpus litseifolius TaxID=425828 RepID=A0AAW2DZ70_9ROSI
MLLGRLWIHDIEVVPSYKGAIVTIYGDTLTIPKPIFGINFENETVTLDGFAIEKPSFERKEEEVEKNPMDFDPYSNNNVVAMMRKMCYFIGMNLGKTMKGAAVRVLTIPTATSPFGLAYKPTDDDLLEMEVRRTACTKAKAKGLLSPPEPLKSYTSTLNGNFVKDRDKQRYWGFPEPRYDLELKTMVPRFELFVDCDNKLLELNEENTNWVPTDWENYMDPDAMTTLLEDAIFNIKKEEYWEACQHALKNPYEARTNDENDEGGEAPCDDDEGSGSGDDNSGENNSNDRDHSSDDSDSERSNSEDFDSQDSGNDRGEPFSDREDEDAGAFYEDNFDDDVDYYVEDIEDDVDDVG